MLGKWGLKTITIYPKLVLSFLLVIVPIYLLSLLMNQSGKNIVETQISQSLISQVHFYMTSFETEISRINRLKTEYGNDDDFLKLSIMANYLNDFEKTQMILAVKNKLYLLERSSTFVENVQVYIPSIGRSIIANTFDDEIPEKELQAILDHSNQSSPILSLEGRLMISEIYPKNLNNQNLPVLMLEVELSGNQIKKSLQSIINMDHGGAFIYNVKPKWSISDEKNVSIQPELIRFLQQTPSNVVKKDSFKFRDKAYFVIYEYSNLLDATLVVYVPMDEVLAPLNKYSYWFFLFSLVALLLIIVFSYWIYRIIHTPLKRLVIAFRKIEKGDLSVAVYHHNYDEFHYLFGQFNNTVSRLNTLVHVVYEQTIRSQRAELKQLQTQISPHFLYNSFFILEGLVIMKNYELAEKMLLHLGNYFKFITRSGFEEVSLEFELKHSESYAEIQNLRFSEMIKVNFGIIPKLWKHVKVPRLILQPIVENAYRHGLEEKVEEGRLNIEFQEHDNELFIVVEDNGDGLTDEDLDNLQTQLSIAEHAMETTGIINVHRRLQLKFGAGYGLTVFRSKLGGLQVKIKIPMGKE